MAEKEQPEFYGGTPSGGDQKVPHTAGRQARLEAAGVAPGKTLADVWREKADKAFEESGSREDAGAAYQKAESKAGRQNVVPLSEETMDAIRRQAKESGRPTNSESGLIQEPTVEKSIKGYSDVKKEALRVAESEGIPLAHALDKVRSEAEPRKKSTRKGK